MGVLLILGVFCAGLSGERPADWPEELAGLREVVTDEARAVEALRAYQVQQQRLAAWDLQLAEQHKRAGEADLEAAKKEQAARRLKCVRQAYEFVLQRYPNNARMHNYYGEVLYDRFGEQAGAVRAWKLASALDPALSAPYNNLAIHYVHAGDYALGLSNYDKALELDPENPDYLYNVVQMYLVNFPQVGRLREWAKERVYREAMKLSAKAARLAPEDFELAQDYAVNFFAAENFGVEADWRKAATAWQQARPLGRNDVEVFFTWLNEARVWIRAGHADKALPCLHEALAIRPESSLAKQLLVKIEGRRAGAGGAN